jgi:hypothetical protein
MGIDTVNLNTTLSALDDSYDTITGDSGTSVIISDGFGDFTLSELSSLGLSFDQDLTVTVNANNLDLLELTDAESSLMLDTGDATTLRTMGIDFINTDYGTIEIDDWV